MSGAKVSIRAARLCSTRSKPRRPTRGRIRKARVTGALNASNNGASMVIISCWVTWTVKTMLVTTGGIGAAVSPPNPAAAARDRDTGHASRPPGSANARRVKVLSPSADSDHGSVFFGLSCGRHRLRPGSGRSLLHPARACGGSRILATPLSRSGQRLDAYHLGTRVGQGAP